MHQGIPLIRIMALVAAFGVGLGGLHSVGAVESSTSPRPKLDVDFDSRGRHAFQFVGSGGFTVPAGKRLIVHHVQVIINPQSTPGPNETFTIEGTLGGQVADFEYPLQVFQNGILRADVNSAMYFDGGTMVRFFHHIPLIHSFTQVVQGDLLDCTRLFTGTINVDCDATTLP